MNSLDETEQYRRRRQAELNNEATAERSEAERRYGLVWSTDELVRDFNVVGFAAPFVVVVRKSDGKRGSLEFQHRPRLYFNWQEE